MAPSSILLKGGTVLFHESDDAVTPLHETDILIEGDTIKQVGAKLNAAADTKVIDCKNKIISPGFVDGHHHLWQTQLKGRHADQTLLDYFPDGNFAHYSFTADDMYWGQLGGCLEVLDAGTTFVVDHNHGVPTADHASQSLNATIDSGLRSVYCWCYTLRIAEWDKSKFVPEQDIITDWGTKQLEDFMSKQPLGQNATVHIGLGFDFFFLPKEIVVGIFKHVRQAGAKLITTHVARSAVLGGKSSIIMMKDYGILGPDVLISHGNNLTEEEYQIIKDFGCYICSTPSTEAQMAMGWPVAFDTLADGSNSNACLGADCHTGDSPYMPDQMKLLLQLTRQRHNQALLDQGKYPKKLAGTVEQAFNMGTINGARAVGMQDKTGSIAAGKLADLIVFDTASPTMTCAKAFGAVTAVVRHSSPRDVETVIVGGRIVKENGKLVDVRVRSSRGPQQQLSWAEVATKLNESQARILERLDKIDSGKGKEVFMQMSHMDEKAFV